MIVLNMIVKDEAERLPRCLDSILQWVAAAVIVDTGSTDTTWSVLGRYQGMYKMHVYHRPWVNFGHNRTEALRLAEDVHGSGSYAFVMDADEVFVPEPGFKWPILELDAYEMWNTTPRPGEMYRRVQLMRIGCSRYEGAVHECVVGPQTGGLIEGATLHGMFDSARNEQGMKEKAKRDVVILLKEPATPRNVFYLAQSYRDAGDLHQALHAYLCRSSKGGWDEEVWYSRMMAAALRAELGYPPEVVIKTYAEAATFRPQRAETFVWWARYLTCIGEHRKARNLMQHACTLPVPDDSLNLDLNCYYTRI